METSDTSSFSKKLKWIAILFVLSISAYTVIGFWGVPALVQSTILPKLSQTLGMTLSAEKVRANPFYLTLGLQNLSISHDGRQVANAADLAINVSSRSIFTLKPVLQSVVLDTPGVYLVRDKTGALNWPRTKSTPKEASNNSAPKSVTNQTKPLPDLLIKAIVLKGGRVDFTDDTWDQPFEKHLIDLDLHLTDFTLNNGALAKTKLKFNTQAGESGNFDGTLGLVPFSLEGNVDLTKVVLSDYLPFYYSTVGFDYQDGFGDANGRIHFETVKGHLDWSLTDISLDLYNIVLADRRSGQTVVNTKQLFFKQCDLIPSKQILRFGKLTSPGGSIELVRETSGNINLASLFSPSSEETPEPEAVSPTPAPPAKKNADTNSWEVRFEAVDLDNQTFIFKDETVKPAVRLKMDASSVSAQNLVIGRPEKGNIKLTSKIGNQSDVELDGTLRINPFLLETAVIARSLDLTVLQPYLPKTVNLGLKSGTLYTNTQLMMALSPGKPFTMEVGGDILVKDVATINTQTSQRVLDFRSLDIKNTKLAIQPFTFESNQITLTDYKGQISVGNNGQHNFKDLFGPGEKGTQTSPPKPASSSKTTNAKAPPIRIKNILLQNGQIAFSDQSTTPNFDARLVKINGHIADMNPTSPADIKLTGLWEDLDPIEVQGTLNPFTQYPQTLLSLSVKGLNMSTFSPYSGKYLGREISRGNLSLNLNYKVDGSQLDGTNIAVLEDLDLGKAVDSPDVVSLPIELVVTLLKDLNDDIYLDLPVSGNLTDPKFRLGGTILRILGNLITKVVTAPFTMIGSIFGGGESLGFIDFDPGKSDLLPSETEKLKTLANALGKKTSLRLDILGDANPDRDAKALQKRELLEMIATIKKPVPETVSAETILALDDYDQRVIKLFENMAKSNPKISTIEKPTITQMEQALLDQISITDVELQQLANRRARMVEGFFLDQEQLDPSRFFILKPDFPTAKKGGPAPASQVRFTLR